MRLPLVFIMITVVIDAMGIGLIMPVMPDLLTEVQGGSLANAAIWGGVLSTSFAVMQFLFGPVIGGLSDRFGRRPVLLVSLVVMAADYIVMAVAGSIWLLLVGRIVGGITAATHSTANAYIADISKPEDKAANFGLIGAAFGIGFVLGPIVGGLLAEFGTRAPFYAAAALAALNAAFGYFVLKETVTDKIRRPFRWARANPFGAFKALGQFPGIRKLLFVYFIYQVAFGVYPAIWSYFGKARFDWDPAMIGLSLALFGIMLAIVQGGLIRPILRIFGERGTVIYGHIFDVMAFTALAFVTSGTLTLILIPLASIAGVITPALQGIMSKAVGDDQQGELQGALTSASAVAMILSYSVMSGTFAFFTRDGAPVYMPGAPFLLSAVLMVLALIVFMRSNMARRVTDD
ncbi:Tetracycline resistance protein, class C [Ascidiaceihabitans donghaensis]|uniref:Tetracycline resistance protein, class C n=1 Tax=Ascidiaceihabitans donghaensis TaxID=1510460 RepID=A0A2R8BC13_9RHOB|nr:TCR/Tet family MFS transporter [Ascidiaceihabitans donghaensis]SPH20467.1 Tetracycline resistance protein, class C [Ascidiaceihabitans donghaensis]